MPGFTESNITLEFPDDLYFRLEKCPAYQKLSGYAFKEMDVCWLDERQNLYWLLELKDFTKAETNDHPESLRKRTDNLIKKSIDTLNLFTAYKHHYQGAASFSSCFNRPYPKDAKLKLVNIIHCMPSQLPDIQHLNDQYRRGFQAYAKLFDLTHFSVIAYELAKKKLPFVG
jgi:hypothetical protein